MAGSQVRCLESEEPYVKITESNPEFYYSEGQRLALEALLSEGEEAFKECLAQEKLRPFLSDAELKELKAAVKVEDGQVSGSGGSGKQTFGDEGSSLSYWPGRSDEPTPELDLGWPDNSAWKGITRAEVYTHPPGEGEPHIKELVRRCIQQANKVIAIVMDVFSDPDILLDLYDAAVRRRVPVYVVLSRQHLPSFLTMAEKTCLNVRHTEDCYFCEITSSIKCPSTKMNCVEDEDCFVGEGVALGVSKIKNKGCTRAINCGKEQPVTYMGVTYSLVTECCKGDLCNASHLLTEPSLFLQLALLSILLLGFI
ncbi:hypothetical protein JD844_001457 [Phrynosoma platyrhinos]|uniref:Scaffolding anchor of CK1 domain-containing protein n=1 Tax=Phrynosoma platyrhinos TaxID=52577 RepID=A0ABQ7TAL2_PHRPL|nr:hypothetical protein JD844_001457 [Phrynosoma platyrhinos]